MKKGAFLAVIAGMGLLLALVPSPRPLHAATPARQVSTAFGKVLEDARKERSVVLWVRTPVLEKTHQALKAAFERRFGFSINMEWLPLHQRDANTRLVTEVRTGRNPVDIVSGSFTTAKAAFDDGLMEQYDWARVFGQELPGIKEAVTSVIIPELQGKMVGHWDLVYVMAFNSKLISRDAVPTKLENLVDPKWRGKFAIGRSAVLEDYGRVNGKEAALELTRKLVANKPLILRGAVDIVSAVSTGQVPLGIAWPAGVETEKAKGAPIDWRPFAYAPLLQLPLFVPKNPPHPNLARLFLSWMVTEGMGIQWEHEFIGRVTDPNSRVAQIIAKEFPGAPIWRIKSIEDLTFIDGMRKAIENITVEAK